MVSRDYNLGFLSAVLETNASFMVLKVHFRIYLSYVVRIVISTTNKELHDRVHSTLDILSIQHRSCFRKSNKVYQIQLSTRGNQKLLSMLSELFDNNVPTGISQKAGILLDVLYLNKWRDRYDSYRRPSVVTEELEACYNQYGKLAER